MTETRKVYIAIPTHDGNLRVSTVQGLVSEIQQGRYNNTIFHVSFWEGDSIIPSARNGLLSQFLEDKCEEYTDFVFINADIGWMPGALQRLLSHDVDFVAATYRTKSDDQIYNVKWINGPEDLQAIGGLVEVARLPAGFFRMTRRGIKRVQEKVQPMAYTVPYMKDLTLYAFYQHWFSDGQLLGEDYMFCDLIREAGEHLYLDPSINISHIGSKAYQGNLEMFLADQERASLPAAQKAERDEKLMAFAQSLATPSMDRLLRLAMGQQVDTPAEEAA